MALPENSVEIPGVDPPENGVDNDVVTPLLPSEYDIDNKYDEKGEGTDTSTQ